jgi:SAM-dependent methyltransferase
MEREQLRTTFEQVPEVYERARPTYPDELFDDLAELAGLAAAARVLEVGCGTGQATLPLARRGYSILCVELGEALAAAARRNLAGLSNVEVVHANFETWEPERGDFDAIVAFTAFHWVDPELRYAKAARLLRNGGSLAVAGSLHVRRPDGDPFWTDVQEDYDTVVPSPDNRPPPMPDEVDDLREEIEASGYFDYLVKPVDPQRLAQVVERLTRSRAREVPPVEKIAVVSAGGAKTLLDYEAIHWIEADGDYSRVHTYDRAYLATSSLRELEELLPATFARVHRSHLVNLAKVAAVRRAGAERIRLELDDERRTQLYDRIRRRIGARPDGRVVKTYITMLNVARKR